jgi:hypothetical protein
MRKRVQASACFAPPKGGVENGSGPELFFSTTVAAKVSIRNSRFVAMLASAADVRASHQILESVSEIDS